MPTPSLAFNNLRTFAITPEAAGGTLRYLARYSPDLHPIEMRSTRLKAYLRKLAKRTVPGIRRAIVPILSTLLEIGAVALCIGNPAYAFAASKVGLACHIVRETYGAASHCGLFIFVRRLILAQFSLAGGATTFNTDFAAMEADRAAFFKGDVYTIRAPEGETQEDFQKSVSDWANRYRAPYYDAINGPNSNSAAAFPLIMSKAELPNVQQGMLGAWQLGYWSFLRDPTDCATLPNATTIRRAQRNPRTRCRPAEAARSRGDTRRAGSATPAITSANDAVVRDQQRTAGRRRTPETWSRSIR